MKKMITHRTPKKAYPLPRSLNHKGKAKGAQHMTHGPASKKQK